MSPGPRHARHQLARFEIVPDGARWRWRFFDGVGTVPMASRPLTLEQCFKALQILRNTVDAPIFVVR